MTAFPRPRGRGCTSELRYTFAMERRLARSFSAASNETHGALSGSAGSIRCTWWFLSMFAGHRIVSCTYNLFPGIQ